MIDIEKFICSLLADHPEGVAVRGDIHRALKEQGLEYKDGKIVPIEDKTELKESEDERIKKEIVRFIQMEVEDEIVGNKWLAYLEKQGEKQKLDGSFVNIDDVREDFVNEVYRVLDADPNNDRANQIIDAFDSLPTLELEKQGEQKPIGRKDFISIPFGTDSEFIKEAIAIPDGCVATIEGNRIHIKKK